MFHLAFQLPAAYSFIIFLFYTVLSTETRKNFTSAKRIAVTRGRSETFLKLTNRGSQTRLSKTSRA